MRRAILTGATGFIGSWLLSELLQNDYEVMVVVRDRNRLLAEFRDNPRCFCVEKEIHELAISDFGKDNRFHVFFHLAWGGVSTDQKDNIDLQLKNIQMAVDAVEICGKLECDRFICAGTVAEYALSTNVMNLNDKQTPNDIYGAAKTSAHFFLDVKARQLNQPFIWMVIPSTFGERRSDNNILTYTIKTLLRGEKPQYGCLEQMWDFLYVGEVVRAIRYISERGTEGKIYGIGSGRYRKLKDYIIKTRDLIDPDLPLGIGESPALSKQSFSSCVNIYDLIKDTGFVPEVSFEEGMKRTIEYYRMQSAQTLGGGTRSGENFLSADLCARCAA